MQSGVKQAHREGGCKGCNHIPPRAPDVHFFVDQRFKTKWINIVFLNSDSLME